MPEEVGYSDAEAAERAALDLPGWHVREGCLCRSYQVSGFKSAMVLAGAVAHLAEAAWHHPELVVAFGSLTVRLRTHSARAITAKDFALAAKIDEVVGWRPAEEGVLDGTPADPRFAYLKRSGA